ncbi:MAG: hypothetical protein ACXVID_11005, partial [Thermoanaerobaculia bacterium]
MRGEKGTGGFLRKEEGTVQAFAGRARAEHRLLSPLSLKEISLFLVLSSSSLVFGKSFLTQEEALRLAFPRGAVVTRKTAFLSEADRAEVALRSGGAPPPGLIAYYVAAVDGMD